MFALDCKCFITCAKKKKQKQGLPGGPAVKTLRSQCRGPGFGPWSGELDPACQLRVLVLQLKIPHATTKTWCSQVK